MRSANRLTAGHLAVVMIACMTSLAPAQKPPKPEKVPETKTAAAEREAHAALQKLWFDLAQAALEQRVVPVVQRALARAKDDGADPAKLASLQSRLDAIHEPRVDPVTDAREATACKQAAARLDKLAAMDVPPADEERFEGYLWRAFALEPGNAARVGTLRTLAADAAKKSRWQRAQRVLAHTSELDPAGTTAGRYAALEESVATEDAIQVIAPTHPMRAFVALPKGWNRQREWPVLVNVEGAGCGFLGACRGFRGARGDLPFIVVTPLTFTNTNDLNPAAYPYPAETLEKYRERGARFDFDVPGLQAVLALVRERFRGEARFCMTGFSGGGFLTYWWMLHRPGDLVAAAPACANYVEGLALDAAHPTDPQLPIHIFEGEKDENRQLVLGKFSPGLDEQNDQAERALKDAGLTHLERTRLPGVGHSPCAAEVMKFFAPTAGLRR